MQSIRQSLFYKTYLDICYPLPFRKKKCLSNLFQIYLLTIHFPFFQINNMIYQFNYSLSYIQFKQMDMRKLIDDTDFDNLNELSKRWKKDANRSELSQSQYSHPAEKPVNFEKTRNVQKGTSLKQNNSQQSNTQRLAQQTIITDIPKKKRQIMPQIIDEDTQHFRNRLQNLLNIFKTDAVTEFMSMKRSMLDYQKDTIKTDTQKYLNMYQQKHQQLLQTKQKLISITSEVQRKGIQIQLMSNHIAKLSQRLRITKYLSRPFSILYENKVQQKMMKFKFTQAVKFNDKRLKNKSLNGWRNIYRESYKQKEVQINNNKIELEVRDIVGRYQKEIQMLKQKLAESMRKNEQYENNQHLIQQNLKKAFLRGISSMNMEAMSIFSTGNEQQHKPHEMYSAKSNNSFMQQNHMGMSRTANHLNHTTENVINPSNSSVMINKQKVESKDHKWKQAPILGVQQKHQIEQPKPILIRPTTEAKVIRIVDGKSNVQMNNQMRQNPSKKPNVTTSSKIQSSNRKKL